MSVHIDRVTNFCREHMKKARRAMEAREKETGHGWEAVAFKILEVTEVLKRMSKISKGAATDYYHSVFSPVAISYVGALIYQAAERAENPYSMHHIAKDEDVNGFLAWHQSLKVANKEAESHNFVVMIQHFHGAAFILAGRHLYETSPGLAERLDHTALRGLLCDHLRLPYPSIYVVCPPCLQFKVWNDETGWHDVEGVYVTEDQSMPLRGNQVPLKPGETGTRGWRLMVVGLSKNSNELDDAVFYFNIRLPDGKTIDEQLELFVADNEKNPIAREMHIRNFDVRIFKWVMNVVLYTTSANIEMETYIRNREARMLAERISKLPSVSKKRDRLKEQLKGMSTQTVKYLGRSMKGFAPEQRAQGGVLIAYQQVEGHWRRVPHGPRSVPLLDRPRNLRWIEPYWRGPEDGPISAPKHLLRETEASHRQSNTSPEPPTSSSGGAQE